MTTASMTSHELARRARRSLLEMSFAAQSSHIGSALSVVDILSVLYAGPFEFDSGPNAPARDCLVFSKGHATAALYAILAHRGILEPASLNQYGQDGSELMQHSSHEVPGVDFSTGSLGHGLSLGCGAAEALRLRGTGGQVVVIASDGDLNAGSTWEGIMYGASRMLGNLTLIIDANGLQSLGPAHEVFNLEPLDQKFAAFGWRTTVVDGHDHEALRAELTNEEGPQPAPLAIVARTVKGKGVSFMEGRVEWHYRSLDEGSLRVALDEVGQG